MVLDDTPVFAEEYVEFIGDPILLIVGEDPRVCEKLVNETQVAYETLAPVLDIVDAATAFFDYHYHKGDFEKAQAEADEIYEEEFRTGRQEHVYLEPQGMSARFHDGKMTVQGSLQCPYYVHGALCQALGLGAEKVQVIQDLTGGGFGGKEAFPSILACQVAAAAYKAETSGRTGGKEVRVIFDRHEDLEYTGKRHPSRCRYRAAIKNGEVCGLDAEILFDAGAYTTLSAVVLQRGIIAAMGVYNIPHLKVTGKALKTNTVPSGAYRGFGAPQVFFAVETLMSHLALKLGEEPLAFKTRHLVKQGDKTSTGGLYHFPVPLTAMIEEVDAASGYREKRIRYNAQQQGRYRRGIGMGLCFHGAGFTGSGERDHIKAVLKLKKYPNGTVEILASQGEIGQGIKTTLCKIAATELRIPFDKVIIESPDTDRVPDSGPTVASRSLMIVGELVRRAALRLRNTWKEGEEQIVEEHYREPGFMIPFHLETFSGDAYPTYAWAVAAVELRIDTLTGAHEIVGAWGSFDVGTPIDRSIVVGQMEGGMLQGLGYASMEKINIDEKGKLRNITLSDYIIPSAQDAPVLQVLIHGQAAEGGGVQPSSLPSRTAGTHIEEFPDGPYGAKGAGELPVVPVAPAYLEAVEQAITLQDGTVKLRVGGAHIPFSPEDTLAALEENNRG
jgi:CO/xanthine dehydrogenase Mo-binding subunit